MTQKFDNRKSDPIALKILEIIRKGGVVEKFKKFKKEYGTVDITEWSENIAYPVTLREGVYLRDCIRKMGGNEWDWVKYINLALLYDEGEVFGSGSE